MLVFFIEFLFPECFLSVLKVIIVIQFKSIIKCRSKNVAWQIHRSKFEKITFNVYAYSWKMEPSLFVFKFFYDNLQWKLIFKNFANNWLPYSIRLCKESNTLSALDNICLFFFFYPGVLYQITLFLLYKFQKSPLVCLMEHANFGKFWTNLKCFNYKFFL